MRRTILTIAAATAIVLGSPGIAEAATANLGGATASSVGPWVKPTGCSQLPVEYAGLPADQSVTIHVLDAVTRSDVGSKFIMSSEPRTGRVNIQVCGFQVEGTSQLLLSMEASGSGAADSEAFGWSPKPNTVRCVNKRTYTIKEYTAKTCPTGWVKR